jgi:Tfp pilus assembly protein PilO
MAKENPLQLLAKKPLGVQLGVLAGVLLVLGFLYHYLFYGGMKEEKSKALRQKTTLSKNLDDLREEAKELEELRRGRQERKLKIEKGLLKLPAKSELPAFLKQLQNQAGAAGVKLKKYSQQRESKVQDFVRVPYRLEATGTFHQMVRYFWLLWEYSKSDSGLIITIENMSLGSPRVGPDGMVLSANFTASTFRQSEKGDTAAALADSGAPETTDGPTATPPAGAGAPPPAGGASPPAGGASPPAGGASPPAGGAPRPPAAPAPAASTPTGTP